MILFIDDQKNIRNNRFIGKTIFSVVLSRVQRLRRLTSDRSPPVSIMSGTS